MATSIVISCPQCSKQSKAPAEVQGKKIRCKACGHIFAVSAPESKASSARKSGPKQAKEEKDKVVKSFAEQMIEEEFQDDSNPYVVTHTDLRPRCPHCAAPMDDGDVICLVCGYNTRTRTHGVTTRVLGATVLERIIWLLPGIACVLAVGALIFFICALWIWIPDLAAKDTQAYHWWLLSSFPGQVWFTVISLFIIWFTGRFAVKRLILHPSPPEKIKR